MGQIRAEAAARYGAQVRFVFDDDVDRAKRLADRYPDCRPFSDNDAINWEALDALFLCTPPHTRGPLELRALDAGVPFFVEKPIGCNTTQIEPVLRSLADRPLLTAVGYMNRYRASVVHLRQQLAEQEALGLSGYWLGTRYRVPWWSRPEQSGGPVNEQTTHLVDLGRYLLGEVESVQALQRPEQPGEPPATTSINLRFHNGALFSLL